MFQVEVTGWAKGLGGKVLGVLESKDMRKTSELRGKVGQGQTTQGLTHRLHE